jgi:AraC family transcriptional regulator
MLCNSFNPEKVANVNRINYSELKNCVVENYSCPTYSLKYTISGTEHYLSGHRSFAVGQGRFFLVNKDTPLDVEIYAQRPVRSFCIHMTEEHLRQVYGFLLLNEDRLLDQPQCDTAFPLFDELIYDDRNNSMGQYLHQLLQRFDPASGRINVDEEELYFNLASHLFRLQHELPGEGRSLKVVKSSTRKELLQRLKLAREIMDSDEPAVTVEEIARKAALSPTHFNRSFRQVYGSSPYQYILERRLVHSASLIRKNGMRISEIALETGFADQAAFSKAFKKKYGVGPREFQKMSGVLC